MTPDRNPRTAPIQHFQSKRHILLLSVAFTLTLVIVYLLRLGPAQMTHLTESLVPHIGPGSNASSSTDPGSKPSELSSDGVPSALFAKPARLACLPASKLPDASKKLIIIGDVHGQIDSLKALLKEADYSSARNDHVIFAGDMITKGADSAAVVSLAMRMGAGAVRGNHEDKVLRAWDEHVKNPNGASSDGNGKASRPLAVAKTLSDEELQWLAQRPAILDLGTIEGHGRFVVVHAGLVPNLSLEEQDTDAVMNVRTLLYPANTTDHDSASIVAQPVDGREGRPWSEAWDAAQEALARSGEQGTSVVYGHDARAGLVVRKWTYGIDTACVKGGRLTALVFEPGTGENGRDGVVKRLVSIECVESVVDGKDKTKHEA